MCVWVHTLMCQNTHVEVSPFLPPCWSSSFCLAKCARPAGMKASGCFPFLCLLSGHRNAAASTFCCVDPWGPAEVNMLERQALHLLSHLAALTITFQSNIFRCFLHCSNWIYEWIKTTEKVNIATSEGHKAFSFNPVILCLEIVNIREGSSQTKMATKELNVISKSC